MQTSNVEFSASSPSLIVTNMICLLGLAVSGWAAAQGRPVIDVHFHTDTGKFLPREVIAGELRELEPRTRSEMIRESLAAMRQFNIVHAITSGPDPAVVKEWRDADPARIVPAIQVGNARLDKTYLGMIRQLIVSESIAVIGEVALQYEGFDVSHPAYDAYFSLADQLGVPIAVHLGPGPHDVFDVRPQFRVASGDPLYLETVLRRHPDMRIYVMHAGWPFIENMIAIMHTYKNVFVDTAFINTALPREELHHVLRRMVGAGLGDRIMFGSDPHPGAITMSIRTAIERIDAADFLNEQQKSDIFYGNAARFFRLSEGEQDRAQP